MKSSDLQTSFTDCHLHEVILQKHGPQCPSTYHRNTQHVLIDSIWATSGLNIKAGGYFAYEEVFINNYHQCLWMDITYVRDFGHNTGYPNDLSFCTLKAGASNEMLSILECMSARNTLKGGFPPYRWQLCIHIMISKHSGIINLNGIRTIILFPVDCNYVFKFIE